MRYITCGWPHAPKVWGGRLGQYFQLQEALGIPKRITPIVYLCIGYISHFHAKPELESAEWLPRLPIEDLVYFEQCGKRDEQQSLISHLQRDQAAAQEAGSKSAAHKFM